MLAVLLGGKASSVPTKQFLVFTNGAIPTDSLEQLIQLSKIPAPAA